MKTKIVRLLLLSFISIMLAQMVSATTTLNIYLDEKGDATFVGRTDEQLANLP